MQHLFAEVANESTELWGVPEALLWHKLHTDGPQPVSPGNSLPPTSTGRSGYSKYGVDELRSQLVKIHTRGEILALARWVMRARGDWRYRDGAIMHPLNPSPEERARVPSWYRPARCGCPVCEKTAPPTKTTVVYR